MENQSVIVLDELVKTPKKVQLEQKMTEEEINKMLSEAENENVLSIKEIDEMFNSL
jgi:Ca2+-binding EF-hand superfamily protein